eukprot:TRINITY_DN14737_c0_g1_i1.p3 TRINITY_DN14737_c0_g1~~TRINITY_DN14737_c0_g1_i1.p3  ORF type:complete len:51 (-),score=8.34 TRINITY_DN14737_c0_g1_i1:151-303(-)
MRKHDFTQKIDDVSQAVLICRWKDDYVRAVEAGDLSIGYSAQFRHSPREY